jgi:hypothetical protein
LGNWRGMSGDLGNEFGLAVLARESAAGGGLCMGISAEAVKG